MRPLTAVLICTFAALFYVACASPEPSNTNSASSTTANSNSTAAPAMTTPNPSPTPNPAASAQPGPTVVTAKPAASPGAKPGDDKPASAAAPSAAAAELFTAQKCTMCHGPDGKGKVKGAPDFTDAAWQKKQTDAEMIETIKKGHKPMPGYEDKLSADQINALVAYVRSFAKK
jgi:mono/diheme cytochrome c family protein